MIGSVISFRFKTWDVLMLVGLVTGVVWTVLSRVPSAVGTPVSSSPSPREGFFAPDFTLDTLHGEKIKLSDLRDKIVIVNFWATWCLPCREETPAVEKACEEYKESGIVILGVNLTNQDSLKDIAAFVPLFTDCQSEWKLPSGCPDWWRCLGRIAFPGFLSLREPVLLFMEPISTTITGVPAVVAV